SPPTALNRMKTSRMTPSIVGIICHRRRMMYAVIASPSSARRAERAPPGLLFQQFRRPPSLGRRRNVNILPLVVQDRVFLETLHPRLHQHVPVGTDVEPPRRVGLDDL